ncbi:MAG TPA: LysR family transcriptional regulator [Hyphomonas sp.]|jgi:DNA-binding transcriptional LysR family regulator|uniref:Transcriptional regulator, LysR family n=7 Tax=root TaxID=1 RepID=A0A160TYX5_9ZZZZ|nr:MULTISPECIES: LysR family transcriptional regulator [unclassified Hyphomonas]MAN92572.1 LysR family transcriptional regulator [Hyphomonadaceae bacterium]KCZ65618.1 LysR family transcriptional regulator [Hyphomonas sp. L-53-1-40]MAA81385.1 LysR family transcriptional regulator [Hyphomonas sp.]MAX85033.1 LysR family transcriptional regulator [Hyphomonas sp.]MBG68115.1 LysR family transcriptional regulator [Hyphomonas sp.]|tara:strand:- start:3540 stop:4448 length:909 start_codon:yes stop_codon:yes gene_type:complete
MDWGKLKSFHAAAEAGSLTSAGERLGISQSAVSRQIAALEEALGVSLFQRHARGLVLTDSGHTLFRSTMEMATAAQSANALLKDQQETPQGELIVAAPVAFGSTWLVPRLGGFARKHPDMNLDLRLDDSREYDLLKLEAECAIRLWAADKADLIQRKLGTVATNLYASPEYLKAYGMPRTPQDLDNHRIIAYGDESSMLDVMSFACRVGRDDSPPRQAALKVNNVFAMLRAVDAGLGIADVPDYMAGTMPRLVKVLPETVGPIFDLYFIYPSDLRRSKRVSAFRDFITAETEILRRPAMRQN